jgi:hypothetical protein
MRSAVPTTPRSHCLESRRLSATRPSAVFGVLCVVLWSSYAAPGYAQPSRDAASAEVFFRKAKDAVAASDFKTACPLFYESQRLDPGVGTVLNIANCEEKLGRIATALGRYQEARDLLAGGDARASFAEQRIAALQPRISKVTLRIHGDSSVDFDVQRDDVILSKTAMGHALPVDPGVHKYTVRAKGRSERSVEVAVKEREAKDVTLELGDVVPEALPSVRDGSTAREASSAAINANARNSLSGSPPVAERTMNSGPPMNLILGGTFAGIGIAALGTGVVTGLLAASASDAYKRECPSVEVCTDAGRSEQSKGKTLSIVSPLAIGAGILALGAGAYFLFIAPKAKPQTTAWALTPVILPGTQTVILHGGF